MYSKYEFLGFAQDSQQEYKSRAAIHMDCFRYVKVHMKEFLFVP